MEGSLQKIIAAIVGVLILFIIPVYMAYEKVDDIAYSLVLKITQNFVDNVRDKGYISPEMYSDLVSDLMATGNMYDIEIEHVKKRYDPAVYIYERKDGTTRGEKIYTLDYDRYGSSSSITINGMTYTNANSFIDKAHAINEEIITDNQIINKLFVGTTISKEEFLRDCLTGSADLYESLVYMDENSYIFSEGDQINVTVKNSSQTIASIFYSMLTANVGNEEVAKIYVNYGGTIKNDGKAASVRQAQLIDSENGKLFKHRAVAEEVIVEPGIYEIQCWGADGGGGTDTSTGKYKGGKGAYVKAEFEVTQDMSLYVYVGGVGTAYSETNKENGGFNGGGHAYNSFGGGGASDVRVYKGEWDDTVSLLSRIIVAAGGGGSSKGRTVGSSTSYGAGGNGGAFDYGNNGSSLVTTDLYGLRPYWAEVETGHSEYQYVSGSTTITSAIDVEEKGTLGKGGTVDFDGAGGGGSGYYGGSASHAQYAGGGGGLSYVYMNGIVTDASGVKYPIPSGVVNMANNPPTNSRLLLTLSTLQEAKVFCDNNGNFIGINYKSGAENRTGSSVPASPLGAGNRNGCVLIKKIG